jgi:hypothetical protein
LPHEELHDMQFVLPCVLFRFYPNIFGRQKYARRRIKPKVVTGCWLLSLEFDLSFHWPFRTMD